MYDFKIGDKVQVDPALVLSKTSHRARGVGTVERTANGGTSTFVKWPNETIASCEQTRDLVPVAGGGSWK